jgi:hypothetical protein
MSEKLPILASTVLRRRNWLSQLNAFRGERYFLTVDEQILKMPI